MSEDPPGSSAHQRELALDALVAVAARLSAADRLVPAAGEPALHAVAEAAADFIGVTAASVALHDPATDRLIFRAAAGPQGRGVIGLSIAAHEGIAGYVFSTGQPIAVADVAADPRFERTTAERTGYVPRTLLAVPLVDGVEMIGVLELLDRRDGMPFDLTDVEAATRMAAAMTAVARASRVDREAQELAASRPDVDRPGRGRWPRSRRGRGPRHGRHRAPDRGRSRLAARRSDRPPSCRRPRRRRAGHRLAGCAPGANRTTCRVGSQAVGLRRR